jgi:hypothetical protein
MDLTMSIQALVGGKPIEDDNTSEERANLKDDFERQAKWRRRIAEEYPEDRERNIDAAILFERLAKTAPFEDLDLTTSPIVPAAWRCSPRSGRALIVSR